MRKEIQKVLDSLQSLKDKWEKSNREEEQKSIRRENTYCSMRSNSERTFYRYLYYEVHKRYKIDLTGVGYSSCEGKDVRVHLNPGAQDIILKPEEWIDVFQKVQQMIYDDICHVQGELKSVIRHINEA